MTRISPASAVAAAVGWLGVGSTAGVAATSVRNSITVKAEIVPILTDVLKVIPPLTIWGGRWLVQVEFTRWQTLL